MNLRGLVGDVYRNTLLGSALIPPGIRRTGLRRAGCEMGEGSWVKAGCFFGGARVSIGADTFVNYRCFFDNAAPIRVGNRCSLGMETMLCTGSHKEGPHARRAAEAVAAPIHIGDGCWLGTRVTVLPGVTIADGCMIAAGALVTRDCQPDGLYVGVPARRVRDLPGATR